MLFLLLVLVTSSLALKGRHNHITLTYEEWNSETYYDTFNYAYYGYNYLTIKLPTSTHNYTIFCEREKCFHKSILFIGCHKPVCKHVADSHNIKEDIPVNQTPVEIAYYYILDMAASFWEYISNN